MVLPCLCPASTRRPGYDRSDTTYLQHCSTPTPHIPADTCRYCTRLHTHAAHRVGPCTEHIIQVNTTDLNGLGELYYSWPFVGAAGGQRDGPNAYLNHLINATTGCSAHPNLVILPQAKANRILFTGVSGSTGTGTATGVVFRLRNTLEDLTDTGTDVHRPPHSWPCTSSTPSVPCSPSLLMSLRLDSP